MNNYLRHHDLWHWRVASGMIVLVAGASSITPLPALAQPTHPPVFDMAQSSAALSGSWRLANMTTAGSPMPMVPSADLTLELSGDRVAGSGGCNRFMGSFQTDGNRLSISPLASTFKACEPSVMNQESTYLAALQGAQRYEIDDQNQLTITYQTEQGSGVLRFVPLAVRGLW
ncbi:MAG: META domain-containing protein [Synechococcales cyanobacterium M58_A2018_015]|nr:META domain-containing protein [Synechococcales cyanobacterium M58_A2018_015]